MSRIGKKLLAIPEGVTVDVKIDEISVKGPKGLAKLDLASEIKVTVEGNKLKVDKVKNTLYAKAMWGTTARLIENMVKGVTAGFQKQLELNGVGYRMSAQGNKIKMALGFSHPVDMEIPDGLEVKIEGNVMTITGIDSQKVGQFAAEIKSKRPVEPYKGKGFKYVGEIVRRKEGKKASAS